MKVKIMERMKNNYESRNSYSLTRRVPVIIRLDGKAFHTYTKKLKKPFDEDLIKDMQKTAIFLCEKIQGAQLAYTQSDEISILLTDYNNIETQAWFDYKLSKLTSISASFATGKFNQMRAAKCINCDDFKLAFFDSRAFNIPKEEVPNYFIARQQDAIRNSVSMLAQSLFSTKELHKKNKEDMIKMCDEKNVFWENLSNEKKFGSYIGKTLSENTNWGVLNINHPLEYNDFLKWL